jgi:hypothetical protein
MSDADAPTQTRRFKAIGGGPPSEHLISSATVTHVGGFDVVRLWNRGALAGELTLAAGDGIRLALRLELDSDP